jgi:hypothetical protein
MMIAILQNKLAQIGIAVFIALCIGIGIGYNKGASYERLTQQALQAKITAKYNVDILAITNNSIAQRESNNIKFGELQHEINQANANLHVCKLNSAQSNIVRRSANLPTATSSSIHVGTYAESIADSESELDSADLAATLIKHDELYFKCKVILDSWQDRYNSMNNLN